MLSILFNDYELYGCPNCGCDSAIAGNVSGGGQTTGTCRYCNLRFELHSKNVDESSKYRFRYGAHPKDPSDPNSDFVMESAIFINHPRKGIPKWHWEPKDERPEGGGEYWSPRGVGYDLSGFIKNRKAGLRILEMTKKVLGIDNPKSWLDYREHEPNWIQFKFQSEEFNLTLLNTLVRDNKGVLTEEILSECKNIKFKSIDEVDPRVDPLDENLICDDCGDYGALKCIDPYTEELNGAHDIVTLCNQCYQSHIDDI